MTDTITPAVLRQVSDSLLSEVPIDQTVHTMVITLNGAHGGVDVTVSMFRGVGPDEQKTWVVR